MITISPVRKDAIGGALEGAERYERETALWAPPVQSPDTIINPNKELADARGRDMVQNDGYAAGAAALHKDNIVGSQYRLNAQPNWRALGVDEGWAEEFQIAAEARFNALAESQDCWLDAARRNTFTGLVRLAVSSFVITGEVLSTAEWLNKEPRRPCKTAIQLISPDRLSNPDGKSDDRYLRRGVERNLRGQPLAYHIRAAHPSETYDLERYVWRRVPAEKPWGRKQVIHIIEQLLPDQTRGISDMVAVLKQMRMTKRFQEVTLQNAVINASFAAAIESELPSAEVFAALGAGPVDGNNPFGAFSKYIQNYLGDLSQYLDASKNIALDGAKIPHLFPGTKLNVLPTGTPGGVGTQYEQSLLRHIAAALGLSYEQFSRDYTNTNYSSARASMIETWKSMQAKKKGVADRFASGVYTLWLEEDISGNNLPLPRGKTRDWFYEPLVKDALSACSWVGASRGQIDEKKETEAAILRIKAGLSTYEIECARLGVDFRDVFEQRAREEGIIKAKGLSFSMDAQQGAAAKDDNTDASGGKNNNEDEL